MAWRIQLAAEMGHNCQTDQDCIELLSEKIGNGISVQESVAAVFALIASGKNLETSVKIAANAGGDTDTIASMAGAILGGLQGISAIPGDAVKRINKVNETLRLKEQIEEYTTFIIENKGEKI